MSELPVRPRRKLVTPLTASLTAVLLVALGFLGGVEVQKRQGGSASAAAAARLQPSRNAPASSSNATVGQVADVHGKTLYVTGRDGATVKVKTNANTKVTRNAVSHVRAVHPGDTVVVQGAKRGGTVKASRVTATAGNAAGGLAAGGGFGGFNGGGAADPPGQR
jgi:hypothetical protein